MAWNLDLEFVSQDHMCRLNFSLEVPGLAVRDTDQPAELTKLREVSEDELKSWVRQFARCTTNNTGTVEGDPLNLVVVGSRQTIRRCFGGRWDDAEAITLSTLTGDPYFTDGNRSVLILSSTNTSAAYLDWN